MDGSGKQIFGFGLECEMWWFYAKKPTRYAEIEKRPKLNI